MVDLVSEKVVLALIGVIGTIATAWLAAGSAKRRPPPSLPSPEPSLDLSRDFAMQRYHGDLEAIRGTLGLLRETLQHLATRANDGHVADVEHTMILRELQQEVRRIARDVDMLL